MISVIGLEEIIFKALCTKYTESLAQCLICNGGQNFCGGSTSVRCLSATKQSLGRCGTSGILRQKSSK